VEIKAKGYDANISQVATTKGVCIFSENTCSGSIYLVLKQALILSKNVTANKFIIHVQHAYKHQIVYTGSLKLQSINRWYYRIEHLS
jgi:hypothetical protein